MTNLEQNAAPSESRGVRPFPGDQPAIPPQQRVRRRNRGDLPEGRAADAERTGGQPAAIVVSQAQPPRPKLSPQEPIFFNEVSDRLPLPAVQPAGQHAQHHLERHGVDHEAELISPVGLKVVGREVEHYGRCPISIAGCAAFSEGTIAITVCRATGMRWTASTMKSAAAGFALPTIP